MTPEAPAPPCALCATRGGFRSAGRPTRRRSLECCSACYQRVRKRMRVHGLTWDEAVAVDRGRRRDGYRKATRPVLVPPPLTYAAPRRRERWEMED